MVVAVAVAGVVFVVVAVFVQAFVVDALVVVGGGVTHGAVVLLAVAGAAEVPIC